MVFQHEFSWSASRADGFATCRRRYYYDYYLSWGGWNASAPEPRRKTYLLKKMTRMPMLAGDLVHQVIQRWFEGREQGRVGTLEESIGWVTDQLRAKYRESRDGDWKMRPAKLCHLAEHHYHEGCVDESGTQAADYGRRFLDRMHAALTDFFESPELEQVRQMDPQNTLACETMSTFELFGTKIYAVPDLAYRDGSARVQILDWKTGSPREADRFQLAIYAFFAQDKWGAEPTQVVCKDVYLGRNEIVEQAYSDQQLEEVMGRIEESMAQMRALHFDADAEPGEPEDFPMTAEDEEGLRECRSCNYRELCARP
jgi:hypothetical protein